MGQSPYADLTRMCRDTVKSAQTSASVHEPTGAQANGICDTDVSTRVL